MKNLRKGLSRVLLAAFVGIGQHVAAQGVTVSLIPSKTTVRAGDYFSVTVHVSGLGNFAPPALHSFRLGVSYDRQLVRVVEGASGPAVDFSPLNNIYPRAQAVPILSAAYYAGPLGALVNPSEFTAMAVSSIGGPLYPDQLDIEGLVNGQPGSFDLFRLSMKAGTDLGETDIFLSEFVLGAFPALYNEYGIDFFDSGKNQIPFSSQPLTINVIPEPSMAWLSGALIMGGLVVSRILRRHRA